MSNSSSPVVKVDVGRVSVCAFANEHDGKHYLKYKVEVSFLQDGTWQKSSRYDHRDLPTVIIALQQCFMMGQAWLDKKRG